jgi:hypothetical protein
MKYFKWSFGILIFGIIFAFWRGESVQAGLGFKDLIAALIISALEVSLSFDNAVINAAKLEKMAPIWRKRFLTWGIAIAVFGMRFVFPIVIVAVFSGITCREVLNLALHNPDEYARHLSHAHIGISSFGGAFLFMLFFEFMFDREKKIHWIRPLEKPLHKIGKSKIVPTALTLAMLGIVQIFLPREDVSMSIVSGISGIAIHLGIHGLSAKLEKMAEAKHAFAIKHAGLAAFIYLEIIDASFSLDGVLGAFALTKDVVIIAIGLAVGAFFVRSMTIMLVEKKTLDKLLYLTHGAYWAIGSLAFIMFLSTVKEVPEIITGLLGIAFILTSLVSSLKYNKRAA